MDFKIIWADSPLYDLEKICSYLSERDSEAAHRTGRAILDQVRVLARFPLIGPTYPQGARGTLREITCRPYRIFYGVDEYRESVEILHIWHGARGEPVF
jgi:plasmid stabilization system protein ParE